MRFTLSADLLKALKAHEAHSWWAVDAEIQAHGRAFLLDPGLGPVMADCGPFAQPGSPLVSSMHGTARYRLFQRSAMCLPVRLDVLDCLGELASDSVPFFLIKHGDFGFAPPAPHHLHGLRFSRNGSALPRWRSGWSERRLTVRL